jgi:galactokinase
LLGAARGRVGSADVPVLEHVLREADRVDRAWVALGDADLSAFGSAMTESHVSLSEQCGVGHLRLDELVATAMSAGAAGARLTGAGFGGCMVALAGAGRAESIVEALTQCNATAGLDAEAGPVFRAYAGDGARVAAIEAVG